LARDEKLEPPLTGLYLCVPALLNPSNVPEDTRLITSWTENTNDPVLKNHGSQPDTVYKGMAKIVRIDCRTTTFDPRYSKYGLKVNPPTFFEIGGIDPRIHCCTKVLVICFE
jgi:hypothetical protein